MFKQFRTPLLTLIFLLAFSVVAFAQEPMPPVDSSVDDITTNLANLPTYFGLGGVVSVLVMIGRRFGLKDGWGGYVNLGFGAVIYATVLALPESSTGQLFEILRWLAGLLITVLSGTATHAGAKYIGMDRLWKGRDDA